MKHSPLCSYSPSFILAYVFISALLACICLDPMSCNAQQTDDMKTTDMMPTSNDHTMTTSIMMDDNDKMMTTMTMATDDQHMMSTSQMMSDDDKMMTTMTMTTDDHHMMSTSKMMSDDDPVMTTTTMATDDQHMMSTSKMMGDDDKMMTTMTMTTDDQHMMSTSKMMSDDDPMMTTMMTAAEKTTNDGHITSEITTMDRHHMMTTDMNTRMHDMTTDMGLENTSQTDMKPTMTPTMNMNMTTGMMSEASKEHMNDSMTTMMNTSGMIHRTTQPQPTMASSDMMYTPTMHHSSSVMALSCFSCQATLKTSDCYGIQNDSSPVATCAPNEICGTVMYDQGSGTDLVNVSRVCFAEDCPNTEVDDIACEMSNAPHRRCVQCCSEHRCNMHVNSKAATSFTQSKMASLQGGLVLLVFVLMTGYLRC
ncbi:uncharacterized protein LOC100889134 [Strongylocentrotus purpuratus]|uniref:Uncharacterized protein n=1 Tax=Strongylocentrotus purpuratus TaxID=7668 RepID=A0A7M7GIR0_STRPU|nr:uncharacterized protein LOC100889134 [Strongylocentrotus purpuratus]